MCNNRTVERVVERTIDNSYLGFGTSIASVASGATLMLLCTNPVGAGIGAVLYFGGSFFTGWFGASIPARMERDEHRRQRAEDADRLEAEARVREAEARETDRARLAQIDAAIHRLNAEILQSQQLRTQLQAALDEAQRLRADRAQQNTVIQGLETSLREANNRIAEKEAEIARLRTQRDQSANGAQPRRRAV